MIAQWPDWVATVTNLTDLNPDLYGGITYDQAHGTFQVLTTGTTATAQKEFEESYSQQRSVSKAERPSGSTAEDPAGAPNVEFVATQWSYRSLISARDKLARLVADNRSPVSSLVSFGPNDRTGHFRVGVSQPLTPEETAELQSIIGIPLDVEIETEHAEPAASRQADTSPFSGGARILNASGGCSTGFTGVSASTVVMLTAGHCGTGTYKTPAGVTVGALMAGKRIYGSGKIDAELIKLSGASYPRIFTGSVTSSSVATVKGSAINLAVQMSGVCAGGSYSGERCGGVVGVANQCFVIGTVNTCGLATVDNTTDYPQTIHGDSGGPVYTKVTGGVQAHGIIVGVISSGTRMFVGQLKDIKSQLALSVRQG